MASINIAFRQRKKLTFFFAFFALIIILWLGFSFISILGPISKPDFQAMDWTSLELSYWVRIGDTARKRRKIIITDGKALNILQKKLHISHVESYSLPSAGQIKIKMSDGNVWKGNIVFENRIDLCKASDSYYSYNLFLNDKSFYNTLLDLCLKHEKTITQNVNKSHIILRRNLSLEAFNILPENVGVIASTNNKPIRPWLEF